jgi:two-component system, OmpR family, sensor histidine kinase CpxA
VSLAEIARTVIAREARDHAAMEIEIASTLSVLAEPELLSRALGNVVRNAVHYAGMAGPIRIAATARNGDVVLTVSDQGPGVPPETLHRLFDAFFRPEAARTREGGGTGLGLAIVKTCVEACGGKVNARNLEPHGLEIEMRLKSVA